MLDWKTSASDRSSGYDLLALPVRRWIRKKGWPGLRPIQEAAVKPLLAGGDFIISATTASGKTEAALLPLISRVLAAPVELGFRLVYVAPLKALVNDQHERLVDLCALADLALHKWHGDVTAADKKTARVNPCGILLITPESLEALLMRRGGEVRRLFGQTSAFVIDELHAFIGAERGVQLLSIMSRIEKATERRVDRVGLSATLGDMKLAGDALRTGGIPANNYIEDPAPSSSARYDLTIATHVLEAADGSSRDERLAAKAAVDRAIAEELFASFGNSSNLIFANSRHAVETFSDLLRDISEHNGVPNTFLPHHGSLSKDLREHAETLIKKRARPTTLVATSTLEMGVDIGSVEAVAQIDAPSSVAALRQRVGRSGRRGGLKSVLRQFVRMREPGAESALTELLRLRLIHALAVNNLLLRGWCEPPSKAGYHFSTLVHQIMAAIAQYSGRSALSLYKDLCVDGPFGNVTPAMFQAILRLMGSQERALIEQSNDGTLLLGRKGERISQHYNFYAVFMTPEEYRIITDSEVLGTIEPDPTSIFVGAPLLFSGRRWDIAQVDPESKTIRVVPSRHGEHPPSAGNLDIHEEIAHEMYRLLSGSGVPAILDDTGRAQLAAARTVFADQNLDTQRLQRSGKATLLFPWTGTRQLSGLVAVLRAASVDAKADWPTVVVRNMDTASLREILANIAAEPAPQPDALRNCFDHIPRRGKYDFAVPDHLLELAYIAECTDLQSVPDIALRLVSERALDHTS